MDWFDPLYVANLVQGQSMTFSEVVASLQSSYPGQTGLSESNIRKFCALHGIRRLNPVDSDALEEEVASCVNEVGGSYGRRMMTAHLRRMMTAYPRLEVGETRVGRSLETVHPYYHSNRQQGTQKQLNPASYFAPFFGYNLHMDQNEKLVDFGVTFVLAVDGCSCFIPAFSAMPRKNNIAIYRDVYLKAVGQYRLWEQVVVDHGKEFYLALFMQHYYRQAASSQRPPPPIVRIIEWKGCGFKLNQRVGYPIKYCLLDLESRTNMTRENPRDLFAISKVCLKVAEYGLTSFVNTWNAHAIPGKGIPAAFVPSRQNIPLTEIILNPEDAKNLYEQQRPGLTQEWMVGQDNLTQPDLQQKRDEAFWSRVAHEIGSIPSIFGATANHDYRLLQSAIQLFRAVTLEFSE